MEGDKSLLKTVNLQRARRGLYAWNYWIFQKPYTFTPPKQRWRNQHKGLPRIIRFLMRNYTLLNFTKNCAFSQIRYHICTRKIFSSSILFLFLCSCNVSENDRNVFNFTFALFPFKSPFRFIQSDHTTRRKNIYKGRMNIIF